MRRLLRVASALLAVTACLHAQSPPVPAWPTGVVDINRDWQVRAGDLPPFTQPTPPGTRVTFSENFTLSGPDAVGDVRWIWKRITLPPNPGPIDLMLVGDAGSFDLYVDGRQVGPPAGTSFAWRRINELIYPLRTAADPSRPDVEVAIRSHLRLITSTRRLTFRRASIGDPVSIEALAGAHRGERVDSTVFSIAVNCAGLALAGFLLILFVKQRTHPEYLWLGLSLVFISVCEAMQVATIHGFCSLMLDNFVGYPALFFFMAAELSFVYTFIGRAPSRAIRLYQGLLIVTPLATDPIGWFIAGTIGLGAWVQVALILPGAFVVVVLLAIWYRRGSREAGLLIVPIALTNAAAIARDLEFLIRFAHPGFVLGTYTVGVDLDYVSSVQMLFLFAISIVILLRFLQVSRDQARSESELASARTIQQFLVPQAFPIIPRLRIASEYRPAQHVGGDFFQVLALPTGGALAVIGDVSGKGLPAAMNVAMIVGALRTLVESTGSPAVILDGLNRRLRGRSGGFTTCLALRFFPDGHVVIANAGHLNPYLARAGAAREVLTDASLPLGLDIDLETTYAETALTLEPGDTLTLITDGVVEARDARTGDLFGFDRTAAITHMTANQIAATAQEFGQDDDIAVLTLAFD